MNLTSLKVRLVSSSIVGSNLIAWKPADLEIPPGKGRFASIPVRAVSHPTADCHLELVFALSTRAVLEPDKKLVRYYGEYELVSLNGAGSFANQYNFPIRNPRIQQNRKFVAKLK